MENLLQSSIHTDEYRLIIRLLRDFRKAAGITQEELAEKLSQTQSFVSKCERSERRLDIVETRAFCEAIGISLQELVASFEKELSKI